MRSVDYTKNTYHEARHAELIENEALQIAWSECSKQFYFGGLPSGSDIFEFGGALGYNLIALAKSNKCHMLELSEIGRSSAAKFGIISHFAIEEVFGKQFDVILCRHVLEHVDSPLQILEILRPMLKPGGRLVLVLPIEKSTAAPVAKEIDFHLFTWNPRTICNLLKRAGYSEIDYRLQFFNGRRLCLPLYRLFGANAYAKAVELVGTLTRSRELVIVCR